MERRLRAYRGARPPPRIEGRTVVVVDDGVATSVTATAALRSVRAQRPARLVLAVPGLVALIMVAGCGGIAPIPVEGLVLLDEQPLAGATVTFTPIGKGGQPAVGLTDDGGTFKLTNADGRSGAVPGEYKVTVSRAAARELPGGEPPSPAEIDKMMRQGKYGHPFYWAPFILIGR